MSIFFSINHGCVVAVLGFAYGLLGKTGSYANGSLYLTYALTALIASTALIEVMGPRRSLIVATALYSVYVLSFPLAMITPNSQPAIEITIAIFGGVIGGFAAGFLWSAQGTYFATSAKHYAEEHGIELKAANTYLASVFAGIFLGMEVLLKLLPDTLSPLGNDLITLYMQEKHPKKISAQNLIVLIVYSSLAVFSVFGLCGIQQLGNVRKPQETALLASAEGSRMSLKVMAAAVALWFEDPLVLLLAPIQVTFGVSAVMLGNVVTGSVVKDRFGEDWITVGGLLTALVAASAALLQFPFKQIASSRLGKMPLMLGGQGALVTLAAIIFTQGAATLRRLDVLILCYLLQGIGRACYEGTNKALYADFFPSRSSAAFSNIVLANGVASASMFFLYPSIKDLMAGKLLPLIALSLGVLTILSYLVAESLHRKRVH